MILPRYIYECTFVFTVAYTFRCLGVAVALFSSQNQFAATDNCASFCTSDSFTFFLYWSPLFLSCKRKVTQIENIAPASDQSCILHYNITFTGEILCNSLFIKINMAPLCLNYFYWSSFYLHWEIGPGCLCPKCNWVISQWKIMICMYLWHLQTMIITLYCLFWEEERKPSWRWIFPCPGNSISLPCH